MRQALARLRGPRISEQPQVLAQEIIVPVPVEGWDTDTPAQELPPTRAIQLDNWIPKGVTLEMRRGHDDHATGLGASVETLMPWNGGSQSKLFAAASASIFDVTSSGAVGAAVVASLGSARFSWVNFTPSGGSAYLWICNGVDDPRHYDGASWATPSLSVTTYADNDIFYVFESKERLFFLFKNTLTFGYLPVESVAGTVANYPLGSVFSRGGRLIAGGTFSHDSGVGPDDFTCFLTSEGELAVYRGTNPGSSTTWAKVGTYYCGEPVGDRPLMEIEGELAIMTVNGLVLASSAFSENEPLMPERFLSARIGSAWRSAVGVNSGSGWQGLYYPKGDLLLINYPSSSAQSRQFVRHRITGGWARFTNWNAASFAVYAGNLYFGGLDGTVYRADYGNNDNGSSVEAIYQSAWTALGQPNVKTMLEARPIMTSTTGASVAIIARMDFRMTPAIPNAPSVELTGALIWGTGLWGTGLWGGENSQTRKWRVISGNGNVASIALKASSKGSPFAMNGIIIRYSVDGQV